jgi:transcriptional repressor NrdR
MFCPFCETPDTKVTDSRIVLDGAGVRRRRECLDCKERFTTYESVELSMPSVIKRDGSRETFNENNLRGGIARALEKRPVSVEQIDKIISSIVHQARTTGDKEISSQQLGHWAMEALKPIDEVGYVRFASVYRRFKDLDAFVSEIKKLAETN